ncbi:hypothetical protein BG011_000976 [Mortierella polycephala]|uniref:Scramblase-domain-containing protein n=1 Tax=Mortierella polycephala TaxID=41804 RepID=A0A9P6U6E0_9FUNG|nr:hypothetical protein BG011_000976 [Mortierella polycephala]
MATRIHRIAPTILAHSRPRTAIAQQVNLHNKYSLNYSYTRYSSLRRTPRSIGGHSSGRGGRITARATVPSRASQQNNNVAATGSSPAAVLAGEASTAESSVNPADVESNVVQGLDVAATPAVVPEDPFGVLQRHDTAFNLLAQPALIMTRQVEMMNVLVGFEQANKYAIVDPSGTPIGYIAEEDTTMMKAMSRQVLRTHRPFQASVLDLEGNEILKIHRPFAFINSRIMISTPDNRLIGEVQQEWHLIRRRYNLFTVEQPDPSTFEKDDKTTAISTQRAADGQGLNRVQFAHIDGGFLALDFDMHDEQGHRMASVNRNFVGFARELFTDSGQYALRFDAAVIQDLQQEQGLGATPASPVQDTSSASPSSSTSAPPLSEAKEIQAYKDEKALAQLESRGGLTLDQRAIMLACAVSIDFDYFSRHSGNGGIMPIPMMMGGGGQAPVPSGSSDNPMGTVIGAGAGAGAGQVLGGAAAGDIAGGTVADGMPAPPPASEGGAWGDEMPTGGATNDWGEDVWTEESTGTEDSGDSWLGGGGDGDGGGFDWGDLL